MIELMWKRWRFIKIRKRENGIHGDFGISNLAMCEQMRHFEEKDTWLLSYEGINFKYFESCKFVVIMNTLVLFLRLSVFLRHGFLFFQPVLELAPGISFFGLLGFYKTLTTILP